MFGNIFGELGRGSYGRSELQIGPFWSDLGLPIGVASGIALGGGSGAPILASIWAPIWASIWAPDRAPFGVPFGAPREGANFDFGLFRALPTQGFAS